MNDLTMTVTGWVATDPRLVVTRDGEGIHMCTFRVAQTARYFDRGTSAWTNGNTEWFSVRVFRDSAVIVAESIRKGQPVIVEGRLRTNEWTDAQDKIHLELQLDATCVGHDLTKGYSRFTRVSLTGGEEEESEQTRADGDAAVREGYVPADEDKHKDEYAHGLAAEVDDEADPEEAEEAEEAQRPAALV